MSRKMYSTCSKLERQGGGLLRCTFGKWARFERFRGMGILLKMFPLLIVFRPFLPLLRTSQNAQDPPHERSQLSNSWQVCASAFLYGVYYDFIDDLLTIVNCDCDVGVNSVKSVCITDCILH